MTDLTEETKIILEINMKHGEHLEMMDVIESKDRIIEILLGMLVETRSDNVYLKNKLTGMNK